MRLAWVSSMALGAVLTLGCSGPGVEVAEVRSASLQDLAANNVSAVVLVRSWINVLYDEHNKQVECERVRESEWDPLTGIRHRWGTNSDCSTYDYVTLHGAGSGIITYPDGLTYETSWNAGSTIDGYRCQDIEQVFCDGTRIAYTRRSRGNDGIGICDGVAVLPDGRSMHFIHTRDLSRYTAVLLRTDDLQLELPDGSSLQLHMPFGGSFQDGYRADFDLGATGSFTAPDGTRLDFNVSGTIDRGETWRMTGPGGIEGTFALDENLAGVGRLERDGRVAAAFRWRTDGNGTLDIVGAGSAEVTPSAAACDFQVDRWIGTVAAMGPAPMY